MDWKPPYMDVLVTAPFIQSLAFVAGRSSAGQSFSEGTKAVWEFIPGLLDTS